MERWETQGRDTSSSAVPHLTPCFAPPDALPSPPPKRNRAQCRMVLLPSIHSGFIKSRMRPALRAKARASCQDSCRDSSTSTESVVAQRAPAVVSTFASLAALLAPPLRPFPRPRTCARALQDKKIGGQIAPCAFQICFPCGPSRCFELFGVDVVLVAVNNMRTDLLQ